ncbi:hypothetical protein MKP07_08230 [Niabella hibiscisoli]|nr:hypothetical protein [Niabella hibiscisoli]
MNYREEAAAGKEGTQSQYNYTQPQVMDIEFLLDATGVIPSNGIPEPSDLVSAVAPLELMAKIALLKRVAYNYVGDAHEPPFVKLTWALETFRCRLQSLNITYKLFKPDGTPLRALIKCSFKEYISNNENAAVTLATSPDLTHVRIAKQGDSLPLMCYNIYGDENLYLEVARVNGLTDFRNLEPGQKIFSLPFKNKCRKHEPYQRIHQQQAWSRFL